MRRHQSPLLGHFARAGFSVVEMLVGLLIGGIVMTAVTGFFSLQVSTMRAERARRSAQMNARTAMNFIVRQLEEVGRDPQGVLFENLGNATLPPAIVTASASLIHYRANLSLPPNDNDTLDSWEDITLQFDDGVVWLTQGTNPRTPVTDGTKKNAHVPTGGLVFSYFDGAGNPVLDLAGAAARESVRRINVSLSVVGGPATATTPRVTLSQDVFLRNVS
jgi:prepilin-type N-terminal cleavage/methylation domain-containing protein